MHTCMLYMYANRMNSIVRAQHFAMIIVINIVMLKIVMIYWVSKSGDYITVRSTGNMQPDTVQSALR